MGFNHGNVYTTGQLNNIYSIVGDVLTNLDDVALNEIFSGNEKDVDKIIDTFFLETANTIYVADKLVNTEAFDYLENVTDSFEETMRKAVFNYFVMSVLPDFELAPHILEWGNLVQMYRLLNIIAARGHSKSYTFSFAYFLWKMYRYGVSPQDRVRSEYKLSKEGMLITNEYNLAKHLLDKIKTEIEENEILRDRLYPNKKRSGEGWGKEEIHTKNGTSLFIKSYGSKMRGYHPTYFVVDDFLNESVLYSNEQKLKYNKFFHTVIYNMLMKGGQGIVVGTPFVMGDLYDDLKSKPSWYVFEYPAIFPDGRILWESMHDYDSLMEVKDTIGTVNFSREILVKPVSDQSSIFPQWKIDLATKGMERFTLVNNIESHPLKDTFVKIVCGTDFALSADSAADYSSFGVFGVDANEVMWLLYVFRGRGIPYAEQIGELKSINRNFRPDIFVIETNGGQSIFADMAEEQGLPVMRHHTGGEKHSFIEGLPAVSALFERSLVRIPTGDDWSRSVADTLSMQLMSLIYDPEKGKLVFVIDHDDDAMMLWQGIRGCRNKTGSFDFTLI